MDADASGATHDYSSRSGADQGPGGRSAKGLPSLWVVRALLALAGLAGVVGLVLGTVLAVVEIEVQGATDVAGQDTTLTGWDLHGVALVVVAAFGLVLLAGALRGARPAMVALGITGLLALGLIVGLDVPELDETGQLAALYEDVGAGAGPGFQLETLGAVGLLLAGGGLLLLDTGRRGPAAPGTTQERAARRRS